MQNALLVCVCFLFNEWKPNRKTFAETSDNTIEAKLEIFTVAEISEILFIKLCLRREVKIKDYV